MRYLHRKIFFYLLSKYVAVTYTNTVNVVFRTVSIAPLVKKKQKTLAYQEKSLIAIVCLSTATLISFNLKAALYVFLHVFHDEGVHEAQND